MRWSGKKLPVQKDNKSKDIVRRLRNSYGAQAIEARALVLSVIVSR